MNMLHSTTKIFSIMFTVLMIVIQPAWGAEDNALYIDSQGIGIGTATPVKKLHVLGEDINKFADNTTQVRIENTSTIPGTRQMLRLVNYGNPGFSWTNTYTNKTWSMYPLGADLKWNAVGVNGSEFEMTLESDGDLVILGNLTQNSDRNTKEEIVAVDPAEILAKVVALPISTWQYKIDTDKNRHLGPMAQDFYAAFGLGKDEKGISPGDVSGVALAAIKGLNDKVDRLESEARKKDDEIALLENKIEDLEKQIKDHSAVVATIIQELKFHQQNVNVSIDRAY